jgi:hypothetical protein
MRGLVAAAAALALLLWGSLVFLALRGERESVTVAGFEWRRTIEVESCPPAPRAAVAAPAAAGERCRGERVERARGTDQIPRWPYVRLLPGEREARRSESYVVLLKGRRVYVMELPKQRWSELREGDRYSARVRHGRVLELS